MLVGPTFIKVGQQFSTRVDVLAPEFVQELGTPVLAAYDECALISSAYV